VFHFSHSNKKAISSSCCDGGIVANLLAIFGTIFFVSGFTVFYARFSERASNQNELKVTFFSVISEMSISELEKISNNDLVKLANKLSIHQSNSVSSDLLNSWVNQEIRKRYRSGEEAKELISDVLITSKSDK